MANIVDAFFRDEYVLRDLSWDLQGILLVIAYTDFDSGYLRAARAQLRRDYGEFVDKYVDMGGTISAMDFVFTAYDDVLRFGKLARTCALSGEELNMEEIRTDAHESLYDNIVVPDGEYIPGAGHWGACA